VYNGGLDGLVFRPNGAVERHGGGFQLGINLDTRVVDFFDGNFAGMRFGFTGGGQPVDDFGPALFGPITVQNLGPGSPSDILGTIDGALLHPDAREVGGNFDIQHLPSNTDAFGNFNGRRP
jgi:hypothetical protein